MANSLSTALGLKLPQTLVFDYPSIPAMAAHVHSLLQPADATQQPIPQQLVPRSREVTSRAMDVSTPDPQPPITYAAQIPKVWEQTEGCNAQHSVRDRL